MDPGIHLLFLGCNDDDATQSSPFGPKLVGFRDSVGDAGPASDQLWPANPCGLLTGRSNYAAGINPAAKIASRNNTAWLRTAVSSRARHQPIDVRVKVNEHPSGPEACCPS